MITQNASFSSVFLHPDPKICHVPREFIFISPYTPKNKEKKAGWKGTRGKTRASERKDKNSKKNNILYHNLMFPPRFESSFSIHPRFLHSLDFHLSFFALGLKKKIPRKR